jgi:hypothetical protein
MNLASMTTQLQEIYTRFETDAAPYTRGAVCTVGCAFCCTSVGDVDITTLEGWVIRGHLAGLPRKQRLGLEKALAGNRRKKAQHSRVPCPFLKAELTCAIYAVRPFSCRRLYSLKKCGDTGPTLHREAAALSDAAVAALQRLDDTGYSGHISHILKLLDMPRFRKRYLAGGFEPAEIMAFGKAHGIVINRFMAARTPGGRSHSAIAALSRSIPGGAR